MTKKKNIERGISRLTINALLKQFYAQTFKGNVIPITNVIIDSLTDAIVERPVSVKQPVPFYGEDEQKIEEHLTTLETSTEKKEYLDACQNYKDYVEKTVEWLNSDVSISLTGDHWKLVKSVINNASWEVQSKVLRDNVAKLLESI